MKICRRPRRRPALLSIALAPACAGKNNLGQSELHRVSSPSLRNSHALIIPLHITGIAVGDLCRYALQCVSFCLLPVRKLGRIDVRVPAERETGCMCGTVITPEAVVEICLVSRGPSTLVPAGAPDRHKRFPNTCDPPLVHPASRIDASMPGISTYACVLWGLGAPCAKGDSQKDPNKRVLTWKHTSHRQANN